MNAVLTKSSSVKSIVGCTSLLVVLLFAGGCSDNLIGPENELEVNSEADSFQWQVTALDNVTQSLSYDWSMTGTLANVDQSSGLSGGDALLRIEDATGTEVYSRSLREGGTFTTTSGTSGVWRVTVTLDDASGAINFRLQKP